MKESEFNTDSTPEVIAQEQEAKPTLKGGPSQSTKLKAFSWVPSLYFAEGIPYTIVTVLTVIFYKQMGLSNAEAAYHTSWLYLPWVIKPFWSPFIDTIKTKRWWILAMQLLMGAGFAGIGLMLNNGTSHFVTISLVIFWLIAFSSATHDIAADGFYIIALNSHEQSFFVGIRNTFYRISIIVGQGALLFLAGMLEKKTGSIPLAWTITFYIASGIIIALGLYHSVSLPKKKQEDASKTEVQYNVGNYSRTYIRTIVKFFTKKHIVLALSFILLFRLGEAQLSKLSSLFLIDTLDKGGLGLRTEQVGVIYGTFGILFLTLGGLLGGFLVSLHGLKKWFFAMAVCMNVPNIVYVIMAFYQPSNLVVITSLVCFEQFGYGFGFTALALFMIYFSRGQYKTTFYAICTGFMALGMMVPGLFAGAIQQMVGYYNFFIWVCICTIPGFFLAYNIKIDSEYGKKEKKN